MISHRRTMLRSSRIIRALLPQCSPPYLVPTQKYVFRSLFLRGSTFCSRHRILIEQNILFCSRQTWEKVNLQFHDNGTLTFNQRKIFRFDAESSNGTEDDVVVIPNIPMLVSIRIRNITNPIIISWCWEHNRSMPPRSSHNSKSVIFRLCAYFPSKLLHFYRRPPRSSSVRHVRNLGVSNFI